MIPVSLKHSFSHSRNTHCLFPGGLLLGLLPAQPHKIQGKVRTTRSGAGEQSGHSNELDCLQDWVTPYSLTVNHYIWYKTVFITHFSTPCSLSGSLKKDLVCKKGDYAFPSYLLKTCSEFKINCPWCIFLLTKWTFIFSELDIRCTHDGCLICYSSHHFNNSWNLLIQLENTPKMKLVTLNQLLFLMHS